MFIDETRATTKWNHAHGMAHGDMETWCAYRALVESDAGSAGTKCPVRQARAAATHVSHANTKSSSTSSIKRTLPALARQP